MTPTTASADLPDPFGTAALRAATLAGWRDSPTRLAEDVAAEADLRRIGYRDRWLTELAANAADAATADGIAGTVRIRADGARVRVANTGAPLTVAGVRALTALRVSPKTRPPAHTGGVAPAHTGGVAAATAAEHASDADAVPAGPVGRFGVGFRATSFADRVDILSRTGSITFDRARTAAAAGTEQVPAQRLAWPIPSAPPEGFATEVVLHCDDAAQAAELVGQARTQAPDLLLELPALSSITVAGEHLTRRTRDAVVTVDCDGVPIAHWLTAGAGGNRWLVPVEPPTRAGGPWRIRPLSGDVLRSPTPTEIPLTLPARLITDLPLTPDRRGLDPGADLTAAAAGYTDLVQRAAPQQAHLLVPEPTLGGGREDAILREAITAALVTADWVPAADGGRLRPDRTWVLPGLTDALAALLCDAIQPLAHPEVSDGRAARTLFRLGAQRLTLAQVADLLAGADHDPDWWGSLYEALDPLVVDAQALEELAALPVPRTDGRLHRGVRGLSMLDLPAAADVRLDWLPVADRGAVRPLLSRLGLRRITLEEVLADPALRQLLQAGDDEVHEELADAILTLLGAAEQTPPVPPWLGLLRVPAADGRAYPVDELLLPGSPLRDVLYDDEEVHTVAEAVVEAYGVPALRRAGAGWGFTTVTEQLPTAPEHDLDRQEQWWDAVGTPPETLHAVRDLDLVDPARWPQALTMLADDPDSAVDLADPDSYTGWWLRRFAVVDGRALRTHRHPEDDRWAGLFPALDHPAADRLRALLAGAGPDDGADARAWLAALADPQRDIPAGVAARAHGALVAAYRQGRFGLDEVDPPAAVRTLSGQLCEVTAATVVIDAPWWVPVVSPREGVLAGPLPEPESAARFATLTDLPLASEALSTRVVSAGRPADPDAAAVLALLAAAGWESGGPVLLHDDLVVAVFDGREEAADRPETAERRHRVSRWVDEAGALHLQSSVR